MLHGLSLIAFTFLMFGTLAFFALRTFPLRCACKDGTVQRGSQGGFDSAKKRCEQVCVTRGGGVPISREARQASEEDPKDLKKKK